MKIDIPNAVASVQKRVLGGQLQEVVLYTESVGW
jgi:hypothetical protein